jgi:hypothetical protein
MEELTMLSIALTSAGSLITDDGQLEFNGYLLGDNVTTFLDGISGWDDLPGIDSGNTPRSNYHGAWAGRKLANQRVITWEGRFSPALPETWATEIKSLRAAFTPPNDASELPIVIRSHGETLLAYGAVTARAIPMDRKYGYYGASLTIQFECSDPRRYSLQEHTWSLSLPPNIEVGLEYPLTYPLDYGEEVTSSTGTLINNGDVITPVTLEFVGPMNTPALISSAGVRLKFNINLVENESLIVDTRTGTVLLNGIADRLYTRSAESAPILSFGLLPGENEMTVTAEEWEDGAHVNIMWRDATL